MLVDSKFELFVLLLNRFLQAYFPARVIYQKEARSRTPLPLTLYVLIRVDIIRFVIASSTYLT